MNPHYQDAAAPTDPVLGDLDDGFDRIDATFDRLEKKIDATFDRLEKKIDAWFNFQCLLMVLLGVLILFDDAIRSALGL